MSYGIGHTSRIYDRPYGEMTIWPNDKKSLSFFETKRREALIYAFVPYHTEQRLNRIE